MTTLKYIGKGTNVNTKMGKGKVERIDYTYSTPLFIIRITQGKNKGERIALIESEINRTLLKIRQNKQ